MVQTKYSEKATSPNKLKGGKKKKTRVAIGAPAYRRTTERWAAASTKAFSRKRSKTDWCGSVLWHGVLLI